MKIITFLIFILFSNSLFSQLTSSDLSLINNYKPIEAYKHYSNTKVLISDGYKNNHISVVLKFSMFMYQNYVSEIISADCAYDLSCSNYSKHSIIEYGYFKGIFLSADRLLRCQHSLQREVPFFRINQQTEKMIDTPGLYNYKNKK